MIVEDSTGRRLCTTAEAAREFGCSTAHIRGLARVGMLHQRRESARVVLYDLDEVRRIAKEHRRKRRKRGGRPPGGFQAA